MKRYGHLYEQVCSYDNLFNAFHNAQKGKSTRQEVTVFNLNLEENLRSLQYELEEMTYQTSEYVTFIKREPKERIIFKLPFRDRVVHWAIMQVVEPIWTSQFTADTYACIRGRGVHSMTARVRQDIRKDPDGTRYCLKVDVKKFYPTINHSILKEVVRKKIKDPKLLILLDRLIDSTDGVPIGNYTSQFFANLYLSEMDHILKESVGVKYYYRYADDVVLLSGSKEQLHAWLVWMNDYMETERDVSLKRNYSIFPITNGVDFGGYVIYPTHTLARKRNKKSLCRQVAKWRKKGLTSEEIRLKECSRLGFIKHCDSNHLLNVLEMRKFSEIRKTPGKLDGDKIHIDKILDKTIRITGYEITESKYKGECLTLQFMIEEDVNKEDGSTEKEWMKYICFTGSEALINVFKETNAEDYPVEAKIVKQIIKSGKGNFFYNVVDPDE
ncbi:MAG: RNA-dependent DNA polymerase [Clostridia bacterium]|nr:RNA-dependent DNA polymerase [Clostridia bacterium]